MHAGDALFQSCESHERLDRRARRVLTTQGTVEQRLLLVIPQGSVITVLDAVHKRIRVIGWQADKGQHIAVVRVDGDRRTGEITEGTFRCGLDARVYRQVEVVARDRRNPVQHPQNPALCRGLDLLQADRTMQQVFVAFFDTNLADVGGAAVIRCVEFFQRAFVDAPDVSQRMHGQLALRVVSRQARGDIHARKAMPIGREACHLHVIEVEQQRYRLEAGLALAQLFEAAAVDFADIENLLQRAEGCIHVIHLLRRDFQPVGRQVFRQHNAVTIEDKPAIGGNRLQLDTVVFRQGGEVFVRDNLQVKQAREQDQHQYAGEYEHHDGPAHDQPGFEKVVLEGRRSWHARPGLYYAESAPQTAQDSVYQRPDQHTQQ